MRLLFLLLCLLAGVAAAIVWLVVTETGHQAAFGQTPPNLKVAFIGDQGINENAEAVLQLIKDEHADMVLHQGDLGYGDESDPQIAIDWDAQITSVLGDDFPYFASVGNHDVGTWSTYQSLLVARLGRVPGASCTGEYGVMAACTYQGLFFILSGAGTLPEIADDAAQIDFIRSQLAQDNSIWRICAWHKNQNAMQLGTKPDEVGWGPYEECRRDGAIIATGHEHSYSRTKTLSNIQRQTVDPLSPNPSDLRVTAGSTFVLVSGLGGKSIRNQDRCLPTTPPYGCNREWASIYTSDQGAQYGALFIQFNVDGDPREARGYFKDINGDIVDTFTIFAERAKAGSAGGSAGLPGVAETSLEAGESPGANAGVWVAAAVAVAESSVAFGGGAWCLVRRPKWNKGPGMPAPPRSSSTWRRPPCKRTTSRSE
jgi:hypothetical protein